jgi:hypothetical protein
MKLYEYDVVYLAGHICGLNEEDYPLKTVNKNSPDDESDWEEQEYDDAVKEALYDKYEITLTAFSALITKLLPLVDVGESPVNQERFKGFSISLGGDKRQFLLKSRVDVYPHYQSEAAGV